MFASKYSPRLALLTCQQRACRQGLGESAGEAAGEAAGEGPGCPPGSAAPAGGLTAAARRAAGPARLFDDGGQQPVAGVGVEEAGAWLREERHALRGVGTRKSAVRKRCASAAQQRHARCTGAAWPANEPPTSVQLAISHTAGVAPAVGGWARRLQALTAGARQGRGRARARMQARAGRRGRAGGAAAWAVAGRAALQRSFNIRISASILIDSSPLEAHLPPR